tara:strand:- start:5930 stop:6886 length:957 start_codon:yes stop_codon:yes gene_type:complete
MSDMLPVCDPHFHLWNIHTRPNPSLGDAVEKHLPVYHGEDYRQEVATLPDTLQIASSVHVETVVGQMEGGHVLDTVSETRWVCEQMGPTESEHPFGIVGYVHLAHDSAHTDRLLERHIATADGRFRGVRMILNHHPTNPDLTWPQVEHGNFMRSDVFRESVAMLGEKSLSFDLQCNPHQLEEAARTFSDIPGTTVILDHLGHIHDGEDAAHEEIWRDGMQALSEVGHVNVKLSMLYFGCEGFHEDPRKEEIVKDRVHETIERFGADRCMFASNYPVERVQGISLHRLYEMFDEWTAHLTPEVPRSLFHDTAARVYRMN